MDIKRVNTVRLKGKLIKWNEEKAFGFIAPNGGGEHVFIHKAALSNRRRIPQVNDIITFSISKDQQGRYCADEATFSGETLKKKQAKKISVFSIYLSISFLIIITLGYFLGHLPHKLIIFYWCLSILTFLIYAYDKSKAQYGQWRTQESTLHLLALLGGWPGAAIAQQILRHKSQKREFRVSFWFTVIVNSGVLFWLISPQGRTMLDIFHL